MTLMDHGYRFDPTEVSRFGTLDGELSHLAALERWIEETAAQLSVTRGFGEQTALEGARLATMWLDDYEAIKSTHVSKMWSKEFSAPLERRGVDTKGAIDASYCAALARASHVTRDNNGLAPATTIFAARLAFCEGFDAPAGDVWILMMTEEA